MGTRSQPATAASSGSTQSHPAHAQPAARQQASGSTHAHSYAAAMRQPATQQAANRRKKSQREAGPY